MTTEDPILRRAAGLDLDDETWLSHLRSSVAEPPPLTKLGPYELIGEIGRGGQGVVYKAVQPRTGRTVALKRVSAGVFATPEMKARFEREIEAVAALSHPHIVTVYGSEVIDGQPVLAMEWIDGVPFDRWAAEFEASAASVIRVGTEANDSVSRQSKIQNPKSQIEQVLGAFALVCDAVEHAHQRGVIHRDLKPSNILVDREGRPHVLDFGLARPRGASDSGMTLTQTGDFVGTPAYASPEQLRGEHRDIDTRSDVFSLAAVLYEALTGQMIFDPVTPLGRLIEQLPTMAFAPPSRVQPAIGRELDYIVLKALSVERERRYRSVAELGEDVRRHLEGQPVMAHPPSATYRISKFVRNHKASVVGAGAFVLLLIAATAVSMTLYFSADQERRRTSDALKAEAAAADDARRSRDLADRKRQDSEAAGVFLDHLLSKANRDAKGGVAALTLREGLDMVAADLQREAGKHDPGIESWICNTLGSTYSRLGLFPQAEPHLLRALELRKSLRGETHLDVADTQDKLGRMYRQQGRLNEAEKMFDSALAIRRALIPGRSDPFFAMTINSIGVLKRHQRKFDESEALLLEALELYSGMPVIGPQNVPIVLMNLGVTYIAIGRCEDAVQILMEAYELARRDFSPTDPMLQTIAFNLSQGLNAAGQGEQGEELLRDSIIQAQRLWGDDSTAYATAALHLAGLLTNSGRYVEAEETLLRVIEIFRRAEMTTPMIRAMGNLAWSHHKSGRLADAEAGYRETLRLAAESLPPNHEIVAMRTASLGSLLIDVGCFEEAEDLLLQSIPLLEAAGGTLAASASDTRRELERLAVLRRSN